MIIESLKDKTILISGASGFIGSYIAKVFLKAGAKVFLGYNKSIINKELLNNNSKAIQLDITNNDSVKDCVKKIIDETESIDVLINNASLDRKIDKDSKLFKIPFEDYPIDEIEKLIEINTLGTIRLTQAVCKQMKKQKSGNIINVGSIYSLFAPNKNLYEDINYKPVDYVISKSFLPNFSKYITAYYKSIRCNTICFTGVNKEYSEEFKNKIILNSPSDRMCELQDLKGAFLFLASEDSSYYKGQTLIIDGGLTVW